VTFTRAAARELKMRIRSTLIRTKEWLLDPNPGLDYLVQIQEKGIGDDAVKKIDAALVCFDLAQIFTLHGFCHRLLSEFSFECKIAKELAPPEQSLPSFFYKKVVHDYLLQGMLSRDYSPEQLKILLKKAHDDPFRLIGKIVSLLNSEMEIAPYPSLYELHEKFTARLQAFPNIEGERLIDDFNRLSANYKGMKDAVFQEQLAAINAIVQERTCSREAFEKLISDKDWFLDQMRPQHLKIKRTLLNEDSLNYPGIFDKMREDLLPWIKEAGSPIKILLRLAKDCQAHAMQAIIARECFSPDQMLRRVDAALDSPPFLEAVRNKYKAAIIDEFQDTDPIQWRIFKRAFLGHLETVCLVGDPKQSIYAFRSADIYTYLDAAKALGKENHKYLDTNFRSAPALITALNCLFSAPQGKGWISLPRLQRAMPVDPVKAGSKAAGLSPLVSRGAIHFFLAHAERGRSGQWPSRQTEENQLFPFLASEIRDIQQKRNVPFEEMAILVKDRFQAQRLLVYFEGQGIPSAFRRGENISHSDALSAFKECFEAVLAPSDLKILKKAMAGILIQWDEKLLQGSGDSSVLQSAKVQMQSLQNILYEKGFGSFFCALLETRWPPIPCSIAERMLARGDLELYQHLRKLAEILIEEEIASKLHGIDFLHYLREIEKQSEEQDLRFETAPREAKGSVALMTVHLSKGLEFDTVFALALASRHRIKEDDAVKKERLLIAFDEQHPESLEAIEEVDAEKMRFLYVAMTRAKQQLYVPYVIDETAAPSLKIGDASPVELFFAKVSKECSSSQELYEEIGRLNSMRISGILHHLSASCSMTYEEIAKLPLQQSASMPDGKKPHAMLTPPRLSLFLPQPQRLLSFSSLASLSKQMTIESESLSKIGSETGLPLGSATGILVHRVFECIFKRSLHHPLQERKIEELIAHEVEGTPLAPFKQELCEMVATQLNLFLMKDTLQLKSIPADQLFQELEFLYPVKEGMMKGFADLVFKDGDKYYLLDWKTNYLGPAIQDYTQEKMTHAMEHHQYFLQASIYAEALKRYVKLFDNRPFDDVFGGVFYVFVRGNAVFHFVPQFKESL
jgi:exodeoxyribonuclease V beta subunit